MNKKLIILFDNVVYHKTSKIKKFLEKHENTIELKFLPPYSSELNAIEHLWKDLRLNVTHNYLFDSIDETVKAIGKYFMNIMRNRAKIRRLCAFIC